ncbi:MAG: hypothetical protein AB7G88_02315 [Thermomicrobiales bacterium]
MSTAVMEPTSMESSTQGPKISSLVERLMTIHQGTRNGYYEILADHGSMTSLELAAAAGASARATQAWLDTQVALGVLLADSRSTPAWDRRYQLPASRAALLLDLDDPFVDGEYSEAA